MSSNQERENFEFQKQVILAALKENRKAVIRERANTGGAVMFGFFCLLMIFITFNFWIPDTIRELKEAAELDRRQSTSITDLLGKAK